jgi:hypothetical protein
MNTTITTAPENGAYGGDVCGILSLLGNILHVLLDIELLV